MRETFLDQIESAVLDIFPLAVLLFNRSGKIKRHNSRWLTLAQDLELNTEIKNIKELLKILNIPQLTFDKQQSVQEVCLAGKTIIVRHYLINSRGSQVTALFFEDITGFRSHLNMVHKQVSDTLWKFRSRTAAIQNALSILVDYSEVPENDRTILLKESRFETWLLSRYADNLRDLSLINANLLANQLELETVSIKDVISESIQDLKMFIENCGKVFEIEDNTDCRMIVIADRNRLIRIIGSIILNSINYSGQIIKISISAILSDDELCLSIQDNGKGIDEEDLLKIFEYGFKGKSVRDSTYSGMGIELYLARKILTKMNGSISIQSGKDIGTTVEIILFRGKHDE